MERRHTSSASGAVTVAFECATDAAGLAVGAAVRVRPAGERRPRRTAASSPSRGCAASGRPQPPSASSAAAASVASRAGASVRALAVPVCTARPLACAGAARACAATGETTVVASPEEVEPAPAPTISAPAVIGSCDNLTLVAQPQASGLSYTWSAVSGDGGDGEPAFTKKLVGASGSRVVIPSHLFPSAGLFTFFLHATDARGYTGPVASLTVERSARPVPSVAIGLPSKPIASKPLAARAAACRLVRPRPRAPHLRVVARPPRRRRARRAARRGGRPHPRQHAPRRRGVGAAADGDRAADGELLSVSSQATVTPPLEPLVAAVAGGSQRSAAISERLVLDGSPSRDPSQKGDLSFSWVCVEASGAAAAASDDPCASVLRAIDTDVAALVLPKFSLIPSSAYTFTLTVSSTWPEDTRKEATATVVVAAQASSPTVDVSLLLPPGASRPSTTAAVRLRGAVAATDGAPPARWAYRWELRTVDDGEAFEPRWRRRQARSRPARGHAAGRAVRGGLSAAAALRRWRATTRPHGASRRRPSKSTRRRRWAPWRRSLQAARR